MSSLVVFRKRLAWLAPICAGAAFGLTHFAFQLGHEIQATGFRHIDGHRFQMVLPEDLPGGDSLEPIGGWVKRSRVTLLEDGAPIGSPHTIHERIASEGGGRFSHWQRDFNFSTPDNSDPRGNGRSYSVHVPAWWALPLRALLVLIALLGAGCAVAAGTEQLQLRRYLPRWPFPLQPNPRRKLAYTIPAMGLSFALGISAIHVGYYWQVGPDYTWLEKRVEAWKRHADEYNLVFVGDSRTYCGIHPDLIDKQLGTHSLNLSSFAHWFATQYPEIQDMASHVPAKTTVVWTVGHQNFADSSGIQRIYPIRLTNLPRYLAWGFPLDDLLDNLLYFNPIGHLLSRRGELRESFLSKNNNPVMSWPEFSLIKAAAAAPLARGDASPQKTPLPDWVSALKLQYEADPAVSIVKVNYDGARLTSLTVLKERGSYYRIEIDPEFFRGKQAEYLKNHGGALDDESVEAHRINFSSALQYMGLFESALETYRQAGIHLIVNEIEEAPFSYRHPLRQEDFRRFMRDEIRPRVEAMGFTYVRADFDQLRDDDYFDYNHLNSHGVDRYSVLLADALRPHLGAR